MTIARLTPLQVTWETDMGSLSEFQQKVARSRAEGLERRINASVEGSGSSTGYETTTSTRGTSSAGGGMTQSDFGGPKAKPTDKQNKQLADLLRKRMAEDKAERGE